jgi:DNA-binding MarR family transcriptional regulator
MVRTFHKMQRHFQGVLDRIGLTAAQFDVMATLFRSSGLTQQGLAEHLLVTKGNIVGIVDRLEERGLVQRQPDPDDRRVNRLVLTDAGRTLMAQALPAHGRFITQVTECLSDEERRTLIDLLRRLGERL